MRSSPEAEVDQAVDMEQQTEDVRNAAAFQEVHQVFQELQQDIDSKRQRIEPTGADAEQAAEVEQMYLEIQRITQHSGSSRQQAMASQVAVTQRAAAPGYYGPQPGQRTARHTCSEGLTDLFPCTSC